MPRKATEAKTIKSSKSITELKNSPNIPSEIKEFLSDVDEKCDEEKLCMDTLNRLEPILLKYLEDYVNPLSTGEGKEMASKGIHSCTFCLKHIVEMKTVSSFCQSKYKNLLVSIVKTNDFEYKIRNQASLVCEKIIEANKFIDSEDRGETLVIYLFLLDHFMNGSNSVAKADMKRMWAMHKVLTRYDILDSGLNMLLGKLIESVTHPNYLMYKEGRQHIAHVLSLNACLVKRIQKEIKEKILQMDSNLAYHYGEIYFTAWNNSSEEVKAEIEDKCIQEWMDLFFKLDRSGASMSPSAKVVFKILSQLHNSRRLLQFSSTITRLYTPLIWRALRSHHPLQRCNAADIFFDVFPLEKPECNIVENSAYREKQYREIMDLLKDECHFCRIIAIKGVCKVLCRAAECLTSAQCREVLFHLADQCANDGSTPLVRQAVFEGFTMMLSFKESSSLLQTILPQLTNHFHDVDERVRKTFALMLIKINLTEHVQLKYSDVVPVEHLIARLSLEGKNVGELIVKLLMKKIYSDGMEISNMISNLRKLFFMIPEAAPKLFQFSYAALSVGEVHLIMLGILSYLRKYVQSKLDSNVLKELNQSHDKEMAQDKKKKKNKHKEHENEENEVEHSKKRKSNKGTMVKESVQQRNESGNESSPSGSSGNTTAEGSTDAETYSVDENTLDFHMYLFLCLQSAWLANCNQLNLPENNEMLENLYKMTSSSVQLFMRFYRGTRTYYALMAYSSLVPISKLEPLSTISSNCMSELKLSTMETPSEIIQTLVYALCAWHRGQQVIELAIDWIDPAFKLFQLNASSVTKPGRRKVTVRFEKSAGHHSLAIKILSILFSDYINEKRLVEKNYESVHDLFYYLERIKVVIEKRLDNEKTFPRDVLTDEFILDTFRVLLGLTHSLHRPEQAPKSASVSGIELNPFSAAETLTEVIEWAHSKLFDKLPEFVHSDDIEDTFLLECFTEIINSNSLIIDIKYTNELHLKASALFCKKLLMTDWKVWFIEQSLQLIVHIVQHSEVWLKNDDWSIFKCISLSLYSTCLDAAADIVQSEQTFKDYFQDLKSIKKNIMFLPFKLAKLFGTQHEYFIQAFKCIIDTCIYSILKEVKRLEIVETYEKLETHPYIVALLVKQLMQKGPKLAHEVLPYIRTFVKDNNKDGPLMLSCFSFLYTVIVNYKKMFVTVEMEKTIHTCYTNLMSYVQPAPTLDDSFSDSFPLNIINTGKPLLQKMGDVVCCSIQPPNTSIQS